MDVQFRAAPALLPHTTPDGVRFTYDAAPGTQGVALARTLNCWAGDVCMMERASATRWQATLPMAAGRHLYKFVIEDRDWIPDPANPWISEDGQNNSCLTVEETGAVLMRQELNEPTWTGWQVLFDGWQLDWKAFDGDMYAHYQTLIALRRQHPALRTGATTFLNGLPPGAIGFKRNNIVVLANLTPAALTFDTSLAHAQALYASGWHGANAHWLPMAG